MAVFCTSCGVEMAPADKFCGTCGEAVAPLAPSGQIMMQSEPAPAQPRPSAPFNISNLIFRPMTDPRWIQKVLLGGIVALIPLIGFLFLYGYQIRYAKNLISRKDLHLPEWNDWGAFLSDGFFCFIIYVVYLAVPFFVPLLVFLGSASAFSLSQSPGAMLGAFLLPFLLFLLLAAAAFFTFPMSIMRYADTGRVASALDFGRIWGIIQGDMVNYLYAYLSILLTFAVYVVLTVAVALVLGFIPCCGWIVTMFVGFGLHLLAMLMMESVFAEYYHRRTSQGWAR